MTRVFPATPVRRNSFFSLLSATLRLGTNFLLFVGIARLYGPVAFGQYTTAHALSTFFLMLADLGLDMLLALEVARHQESAAEVARRYAAIKLTVASAATLIMIAIGMFQPAESEVAILIVILGASVVFSALMNFEFALLRGLEQLQHEALITGIVNGAALLLLVLAGILRAPLPAVALVYLSTRVGGYLIARRRARRVIGVAKIGLSLGDWTAVRGQVAMFAAYLLFGYLVFQQDTLLLAAVCGSSAVGTYQAVFRIVAVAMVIPDVAVNALLPSLSRLHRESPEEWLRLGERLSRWLLLASLPVSLVMFFYPECVLDTLYGSGAFPEAATVMRFFAGVVFLRYFAETFGLLLTTSGNQYQRVMITVVATGINAAANLLVMPGMGPRGAAAVALGTNIIVAGGYIVAVRRRFSVKVIDQRSLLTILLVAGIAMLANAVPLLSRCASLPAAVVACVAAAWFVGMSAEDRRTLLSFRTQPHQGGPA